MLFDFWVVDGCDALVDFVCHCKVDPGTDSDWLRHMYIFYIFFLILLKLLSVACSM